MRHILLSILSLLTCLGASAQSIQFEDQAAAAGIITGDAAYGVAVQDFDRDGWDDFYIAADEGKSRLFKNTGDGKFLDVTSQANVVVKGNAVAPLWGDLNNDGWPDLFVGVRSDADSSALFISNGDGTFDPARGGWGIDLAPSVGTASFADFDNDGWLDLFVATRGSIDRMYRNTGEERFEDISARAGTSGLDASIAMQATWADIDLDGNQDLFAIHDGNLRGRLYKNNGWLPFSEVTTSADLIVARSSMGVAWNDFDNDGDFDVYVSNIAVGNFFENDGTGQFADVTIQTGTSLNGMSWGVVFADFDLDGDEDFFIANTYDFDSQPALLYENRGGVFVDIADQAGVALNTNTYGVASGDFNRDGLPDLIAPDQKGKNKLLINTSVVTGSWLSLKLEGDKSNRDAVGARVAVFAGGKAFYRSRQSASGYSAQMSETIHVGLGEAAFIDSVRIDWGPGSQDIIDGLEVNQTVGIREGNPLSIKNNGWHESRPFYANIYPLPAISQTNLHLELPQATPIKISIYDMQGRQQFTFPDLVLSGGMHTIPLHLSTFAAGLYAVRISTPEFQIVRRLPIFR